MDYVENVEIPMNFTIKLIEIYRNILNMIKPERVLIVTDDTPILMVK